MRLGDKRKRVECGEKDGNGGQRETGTRGEEECCAAQKQIVEESVAKIGRTEEAGRREQKRPVRRPNSALPFNKEGPNGDEERRRRCCACGSLVKICKFDTGINILQFCRIVLNRLSRNETSRSKQSTKETYTAYSSPQFRNSFQFSLWVSCNSKSVSIITRFKICSVSELKTK